MPVVIAAVTAAKIFETITAIAGAITASTVAIKSYIELKEKIDGAKQQNENKKVPSK